VVLPLGRLRHLVHEDAARLVTLTGPAGTGKTRLAAELTSQLQPHYEHGATIVDLTTVTDPQLVASAVCVAFRLRPGAPEEATATLARFLSTRRQLPAALAAATSPSGEPTATERL